MGPGTASERREELAFTVQTIDCILCSPFFRHALRKVNGVLEIKELPITNKIIVVFDASRLDRESVRREVEKTASRAGLSGKIIFAH